MKARYLEPVDGAAVDERGELSESVAECIPDWTHGEHDVQLLLASLNEHVEQGQRTSVCLFIFITLSKKLHNLIQIAQ